jgi:hypothetical protein
MKKAFKILGGITILAAAGFGIYKLVEYIQDKNLGLYDFDDEADNEDFEDFDDFYDEDDTLFDEPKEDKKDDKEEKDTKDDAKSEDK